MSLPSDFFVPVFESCLCSWLTTLNLGHFEMHGACLLWMWDTGEEPTVPRPVLGEHPTNAGTCFWNFGFHSTRFLPQSDVVSFPGGKGNRDALRSL